MKRDYVKILEEQKIELERLMADPRLIDRVQTERVDVNSTVAQIVIGVRRCGKSVVCRMALAKSGVRFGYIDFDDNALQDIQAIDLMRRSYLDLILSITVCTVYIMKTSLLGPQFIMT